MKYIEQGEQAAVACIPQIREKVFASEDFKEGLRSFVERRKAQFTGR
jgi:enoyl-CoA hydratase